MARPGNLGRDQHGVARLGLHPAPDNLFGPPRILRIRRHRIVLRRVVESDPRLERLVENAMRHRLVGLVAERHRAHADVGHENRATAQAAAFHGIVPVLPATDSDVSERSQGVGWIERSEIHHFVASIRRWVSLRSTHPTIRATAASAPPCCTACGGYRVANGSACPSHPSPRRSIPASRR